MSLPDISAIVITGGDTDQHSLIQAARGLLSKCEWLLEQVDRLQHPQQQQEQHLNSPCLKKRHDTIQGLSKLKTAMKAEQKFLKKLVDSPESIKPAHVKCTNLYYLVAIYDMLEKSLQDQGKLNNTFIRKHIHAPIKIFHTFHYALWKEEGLPLGVSKREPIRVDLVTHGGLRWTKVKASSMKGSPEDINEYSSEEETDSDQDDVMPLDSVGRARQHSSAGVERRSLIDAFRCCIPSDSLFFTSNDSEFETLPTIIRQAAFLKLAAYQNPVQFKTPEVLIHFLAAESIPERILLTLSSMGIHVQIGERIIYKDHDQAEQSSSQQFKISNQDTKSNRVLHADPNQTLNLDTTTLLCLVSELCHSFKSIPSDVFVGSAPLTQQSDEEATKPLLPYLVDAMAGCSLVTCQDSFDKFLHIMEHVGGPIEQLRLFFLFDSKLLSQTFLNRIHSELFDGDMVRFEEVSNRTRSHVSLEPLGKIKVVPNDPSDRFLALSTNSQDSTSATAGTPPRKKRTSAPVSRFSSLQINVYGTGDKLHAITVTSNSWMERSLSQAGLVDVGLFVHEPRSLIEQRISRYNQGLELNLKDIRKKRCDKESISNELK